MNLKKLSATTLLAIIVIAVGAATFIYALTSILTVHNEVNIHTGGLEAYWDQARTQPLSRIDWGWVYPGETHTVTFYLYNPGNTEIYSLNVTTGNWDPAELQAYSTLTWDREGASIPASLSLQCSLSLTFSETVPINVTHCAFDTFFNWQRTPL